MTLYLHVYALYRRMVLWEHLWQPGGFHSDVRTLTLTVVVQS